VVEYFRINITLTYIKVFCFQTWTCTSR